MLAGAQFSKKKICGLLALGCLIAPGCSPAPEGFVPANGVIKMADGSPLTGVEAVVRFNPYDPRTIDDGTLVFDYETPQGTSCSGWLTTDGQFTLKTRPHGKVAEVGHYKVILALLNPERDGTRIPKRYQLHESTPWTAEIKVDGKNEFEFVLAH